MYGNNGRLSSSSSLKSYNNKDSTPLSFPISSSANILIKPSLHNKTVIRQKSSVSFISSNKQPQIVSRASSSRKFSNRKKYSYTK